jgi:hypothetical protein
MQHYRTRKEHKFKDILLRRMLSMLEPSVYKPTSTQTDETLNCCSEQTLISWYRKFCLLLRRKALTLAMRTHAEV